MISVILSKLFPDHGSLVAEAVLAIDVLEGRVPGYGHARSGSLGDSEKDDFDTTKVVEV